MWWRAAAETRLRSSDRAERDRPPASQRRSARHRDGGAANNSPQSIGNRHKKVGSGWFVSGGGKEFYDAIYEPGAEPIVVLKQNGTSPGGRWVTLMKNVGAAPYAGKKIRIRVGVKTTGMSSNMTRAELWARSAGPHQAEDAPSTKMALDPTPR